MSALVLGSAVVLAAAPLAAAPAAPTSIIQVLRPGVAESISCASATSCVTVGEVVSTHGEVPTAVRWNLAGQSSLKAAPPQSPYGAQELSISCTGPLSCVAVGSIQTRFANAIPRVDVLTPTGWISTPLTPTHRGADNLLNGVSCPTATTCFAAGSEATGIPADHTRSTILELTIGAKGQVTATAMTHPTPGTVDSFNAISCTAVDSCTAVGTTFGGAGHSWLPLIETMTGTTWMVATTSDVKAGYLLGVSCASATSCAAVGSTNGLTVSATRPIVATTVDGTSWSAQVLPFPGASLISVSCVAPALCRAVGSSSAGVSTAALALTNRSGSWTPMAFTDPHRITAYGQWTSISCPLANQCHLAGTTARVGAPAIMAATPTGPAVLALSSLTGPVGGGQVLRLSGLGFTRKMVVMVGTMPAKLLTERGGITATVLTPVQPVTAIGTSLLVNVTTPTGTSPDITQAHYSVA